jgi:beta-galactosidase
MMMSNEDCNNKPCTISLDGEWDFTYTPNIDDYKNPTRPIAKEFTVRMPVPGYWDDNVDRMQRAGFWGSTAKFNPEFRHIDFPMGDDMPPDASLPFLLGVGWYRKTIEAPLSWIGREITLNIGGVVLESWVWINGKLVKYHLGHSTPFEVSIAKHLKYGAQSEILIAVANTRTDRLGCVIRGFKGFSAGIYRPVSLKVAGNRRIKDCYMYPKEGMKVLNCQVELDGTSGDLNEMVLDWVIRDSQKDIVIYQGSLPVASNSLEWTAETLGLECWSDKSPNLYDMELTLRWNEKIIDTHVQCFGLRLLEREGISLRLNGYPVFLRGATEHAYFPLTCTPPKDIKIYRDNIKKLKEIGFNWLRFHTWVPSEEYMQAADEIGMMIQVEAPLGFEKQEWLDILYTCRKHPSVVIYCCGNEEMLDEKKIDFLREMADLCHSIVPDALFNPQEAMRGIEYYLNRSGVRENNVEEPFPHNPERLEKIREFSDVFGQYPLGLLSYSSTQGDWRILNERLEIYQRPCLSHEITIHGNYLNLDLEHRYEGTRIGTEIFSSTRNYLIKEGLLPRASLYYKNSCAWMKILRKHTVEMARKCKYNAGYDLLGAIDHHWHRCGYPCGIMNEFYELKPGESISDVLQYNGENLLLLDHTNNRNITSDEELHLDLYASLFGKDSLREGRIYWYLADSNHQIHQRGEVIVNNVINGAIEKLTTISLTAPKLEIPKKLTLYVHLSGGEYEVNNSWDFWVFPEVRIGNSNVTVDTGIISNYKGLFSSAPEAITQVEDEIKLLSALNEDTVNYVSNGGRAILLGSRPFPSLPTSFQLSVTGRVQGNLATVIEDHPIMNDFPHEGFCDWQFYNMMEGGEAVVFNELGIPFKPIIEVVSSFKLIRKQASLFELRIGKGKLLVCTLNLTDSDPAAKYLLSRMISYSNSDKFIPEAIMKPNEILKLLNSKLTVDYDFSTDEALDPNAK